MTDRTIDAPGPQAVRVWDPFVRVFHWSLVTLFTLNIAILDDESKAHEWAGYAVLGLVAARILWGFVGTRHARFSAFPPSAGAAWEHVEELLGGREPRETHLSHNPLGALMVYNLLVCMVALGVTGWMMTLNAYWGAEWLEELHEAIANWALLSVGLHVAGVAVETWRSKVPLAKAMVTGWKLMPRRRE